MPHLLLHFFLFLFILCLLKNENCLPFFSEIGDISRFEKTSQLVAYAGLEVAVKQSGEFVGTQTKISKRGSPYLRRAIWLAAIVAAFKYPALSNYYQTLRNRGKAHGTAIGAVTRKLTNIIFAVLRDNNAYIPNIWLSHI